MPVHDWTRVDSGAFHDFHTEWLIAIKRLLNRSILPHGYFAMAEQVTGVIGPDIVALQRHPPLPPEGNGGGTGRDLIAVSEAPPQVRFRTPVVGVTPRRQRRLTIRHHSGQSVVALIEIVSPSNKATRDDLQTFVQKIHGAMLQGIHVMVLDLFPPTPRDPQGIHGAIVREFGDTSFTLLPEQPLTMVSYDAGPERTAYIEPVAVGDRLPALPLFLLPGQYVNVPLEQTYQTAWEGMGDFIQETLESSAG